jgi:hypothetical protein
MKTIVTLKQNLLKSALFILVSASSIISTAQSSTGLQSDNGSVQPGSVVTGIEKTISSTPTVIPASFTAVFNNNGKVDLKWSTEMETNLSHIMVEKSTDGKNYKDAALVFTYGNTTSRSDYAFADNVSKIKSGSVYYRLRSVDVDGTTQQSDIRIVKISK